MLVIFDCDGVLVDSEVLSAQVFVECLLEQGFDIDQTRAHESNLLEAYRGKSAVDCIAKFMLDFGEQQFLKNQTQVVQLTRAQDFWQQMQAKTLALCATQLEPVAGVEAVLKELTKRDISFCVASNGRHSKMKVTLAKTGLMPYVEGRIFSVEDVTRGKPAPDLFLHAAKTMNIAPERTLVVEDSLTGLQAALAAGMHPLAYCPPEADGRENILLNDMQKLGVNLFFSMDELLPLILKQQTDFIG